ncbi:unnamed protein product [Discula destructiva]
MKLKEGIIQEFSHLAVTTAVDAKKNIAIQSLQRLQVPFIDVTSPTWSSETTTYNLRISAVPALIVFAKCPQHVQDAVACGVKAGLKVSARCGNHSYASLGLGGEDDHLIVDLTALNSVKVDTSTQIATVEAGARLGHVASELHMQGRRAIAHGSCPGVGIAGHLLHGGYGWASHNKGLALDWMIGADIVLANGSEVHCSAAENSDLFWALRGAGSNFGIVTSIRLKTFEAPSISTPFKVSLAWRTEEEKTKGVKALVEFARTTPAELNMRLGGFVSGDHSFDGVYYGTTDDLSIILTPLLEKTGGTLDAKQGTWLQGLEYYAERNSLVLPNPYIERGNFFATSLTLKDLRGDSLHNFVHFWHAKAINFQPGGWFFQLDLHGGPTSAISAFPNSVSAYAHRDKTFLIQLYHYSDNDKPYPREGISLLKEWIEATTMPLGPSDWGMYINYVDTELDGDTAQQLYYGDNLQRLQELKKRYDPSEVFHYPQAISLAE